MTDQRLRKRARHVVSENHRVHAFTVALASGDLAAAGAAMTESHTSLRDDFEVSTAALGLPRRWVVSAAGAAQRVSSTEGDST